MKAECGHAAKSGSRLLPARGTAGLIWGVLARSMRAWRPESSSTKRLWLAIAQDRPKPCVPSAQHHRVHQDPGAKVRRCWRQRPLHLLRPSSQLEGVCYVLPARTRGNPLDQQEASLEFGSPQNGSEYQIQTKKSDSRSTRTSCPGHFHVSSVVLEEPSHQFVFTCGPNRCGSRQAIQGWPPARVTTRRPVQHTFGPLCRVSWPAKPPCRKCWAGAR